MEQQQQTPGLSVRSRQFLKPCLLALGSFALAGLFGPTAAVAQCNSNAAPPAPAKLTSNPTDQSYGTGVPYNIVNNGVEGCNGTNGGWDVDGTPGIVGQAAGAISNTATNITIAGPSVYQPGEYSFGLEIVADGGPGGHGGDAGNPVSRDVYGGDGANGGAAARIDIDFTGTIGADPYSNLAQTGMYVVSRGGQGGYGGTTGTADMYIKYGGNGAGGGLGGQVFLTASGSIVVDGTAIEAWSDGGDGGVGGSVMYTSDKLNDLVGGAGGDGGAAGSTSIRWDNGSIQAVNGGLFASSSGGAGADGGSTGGSVENQGGQGGNGGAGGIASVMLAGGTITLSAVDRSLGGGLVALAYGGEGGSGGQTNFAVGTSGGSGGNGGAGGAAAATVLGTIDITGAGEVPVAGVYVNANGGAGGKGGGTASVVGESGGGGFAGKGGGAALTVGSSSEIGYVLAQGDLTNAALIQSIGGGGGGGGQAQFNSDPGTGAAGGDAGAVTAGIVNGQLIANGGSSSALVVQSIGGSGGVGGDAIGVAIGYQVTIGGNGAVGGNGNSVDVNLIGPSIIGSLNVLGDGGVLAQSIGGAGGAGGSATTNGSGVFVLTVGGNAGTGGSGGAVSVTSSAVVATHGDHAAGIEAQSIGGGGGKGGSATIFNVGVTPTASVAVGGTGGTGGIGSTATIISSGSVSTFGSDAVGLKAQSIGGGGGSGGAAVARTLSLSGEDTPSVSFNLSMGGTGGSGNIADQAQINNSGNVVTAGHGATALLSQSIGGGGGTGGDSTAASFSSANADNFAIAISTAIGGAAGEGGKAGEADVRNSGLLLTLGGDAYGMVAQSVGGSGGMGGGGDATATAGEANKFSFSASIGVGGKGGTGGHGSFARADNEGGIVTGGDGADGILAQSVGGGGGAGGGGVGTSSGDTMSVSVSVGGNGGAGGNGGDVTGKNGGGIVTRGTDAVGLFTQSVGGGGGKGGKAGATSGGDTKTDTAKAMTDTLADGLNLNGDVKKLADGIFDVGDLANEILAYPEELEKIIDQLSGEEDKVGSTNRNIDVSVSVGGKGGAAGAGGSVVAENAGRISTFGAQSDGIFAQSIGGGGGKGGGASSTAASTDDTRNQVSVGVGGGGGAGGKGGAVSVTNAKGAELATRGVLAFGIMAQSVGGGGGAGSAARTVAGSLASFSIGVGGNGAAAGDGGTVNVINDGAVSTGGKHAVGIVAQSVGGGGGLIRTMTTDQTFDPSLIDKNPQGRAMDVHGVTVSLAGDGTQAGSAVAVQVTMAGSVATAGRDAHGVFTQSVGGGGGAVFGGQLKIDDTQTGGGTGHGGTVGVTLTSGATISTTGDGAYGILAQSIGGSGGLAGDLSNVSDFTTRLFLGGPIKPGVGNGDNVAIDLTGAKISTTGLFAPAIFAQSVGGGGGLYAFDGVIYSSSASNSGTSGDSISVSLVGTSVSATGTRSPGIMVQSAGGVVGKSTINIDATSSVTGGRDNVASPVGTPSGMAGAIYILGGNGNVITNAGLIAGIDGATPATAINALESRNTTVINSGKISGDVFGATDGGVLNNLAGGIVDARGWISLGAGGVFNNAGTLEVGGQQRNGTTMLRGDLIQSETGRLVIAVDFATGSSDFLAIEGRADLAGSVVVQPVSITNRAATVLSATGGVVVHTALNATASYGIFSFPATVVGSSLQITPKAHFAEQAHALGANQRAVAANLQSLFDTGANMDAGFTALGSVATADQYAAGLNSLSGQTLGALSAFRFDSSRSFASSMIDGCARIADDMDGGGCAWSRLIGGTTQQHGNADSIGYVSDAMILQFGAQYPLGENWDLGGSLGYEASQFRGTGNSARISGDALQAGAYLRYTAGGLSVAGAIDLGYGWYRSRRTVAVGSFQGVATGRPAHWHAGLHGRIDYEAALGTASYAKPFIDGRAVYLKADGYREQGAAPFDLNVEGSNETAFAGAAGMELGTRIRMDGGAVLRPFVSGAYELLNNDWAVTARFADLPSGPSFKAVAPAPGSLGRFAIGADLLAAKNAEFSVTYMLQAGDQYRSHFGVARFTYRF